MGPDMRAIVLILLALAGCGSDMDVTADLADLAAGGDLAMCMVHVASAPTGSTPCGASTCAPGEICVGDQPGVALDLATPADGGTPSGLIDQRCVALPAECQVCGGCGNGTPGVGGLKVGCFANICDKYATGCRFDGATLVCIFV
jgi:hypothetical protein